MLVQPIYKKIKALWICCILLSCILIPRVNAQVDSKNTEEVATHIPTLAYRFNFLEINESAEELLASGEQYKIEALASSDSTLLAYAYLLSGQSYFLSLDANRAFVEFSKGIQLCESVHNPNILPVKAKLAEYLAHVSSVFFKEQDAKSFYMWASGLYKESNQKKEQAELILQATLFAYEESNLDDFVLCLDELFTPDSLYQKLSPKEQSYLYALVNTKFNSAFTNSYWGATKAKIPAAFNNQSYDKMIQQIRVLQTQKNYFYEAVQILVLTELASSDGKTGIIESVSDRMHYLSKFMKKASIKVYADILSMRMALYQDKDQEFDLLISPYLNESKDSLIASYAGLSELYYSYLVQQKQFKKAEEWYFNTISRYNNILRKGPKSIRIEIEKNDSDSFLTNQFFTKWWFILSACVIVYLIILLVLYIIRLNKKSKELEQYQAKAKTQKSELKEQLNQLKHISTQKDRFVTIITNDLNEPVNNLIGFIDFFVNSVQDFSRKELADFATEISRSVHLFSRLLNNVLTWSRIQNDDIQCVIEEVSPLVLLENAVQSLKDSGLRFKGDWSITVSSQLTVKADKVLLTQVLKNIISNAIKYSLNEGEIRIWHEEKDEKILLYIKDQGHGIPESVLKTIFDIKERKDLNNISVDAGTGLGLPISKAFMLKMNGDIQIKSQSNSGTMVVLSLPK